MNYLEYRRSLKLGSVTPEPQKKTPIKKKSVKREKEDKEYSKLRKAFLAQNKTCQAKLTGCTVKATEVHHKAGRGVKLNDKTKFMATCRNCHSIIHDKLSAKEAKKLGFKE